ncbi:MAG: hypothetical protein M3256_04390 [Actinomycetota bacterium]|nr:hypothetical protein [Actinomycetota bacterium]
MAGHAVWLQHPHQQIGDLLPYTFLHRKSAREESDHTGQLEAPDDVLMRDVADECMTEEGKRVMLAQ